MLESNKSFFILIKIVRMMASYPSKNPNNASPLIKTIIVATVTNEKVTNPKILFFNISPPKLLKKYLE